MRNLTPREIVAELDRHIVGQDDANQRERADGGTDQHHVLGYPAEPGSLRQLALREGAGVDVAARVGVGV